MKKQQNADNHMNELSALKWLQNQSGLKVLIGKDQQITITDGFTVEITGTGFLDTVVKLQKTLREMENAKTNDDTRGN